MEGRLPRREFRTLRKPEERLLSSAFIRAENNPWGVVVEEGGGGMKACLKNTNEYPAAIGRRAILN
jgi:hypothetical protein